MPDPTKKTVSASQMAALFDLSPYTTRWLLWHQMKGTDTKDETEEDERMLWGKLFEPTIFYQTLVRLDLEGSYNNKQLYKRSPNHRIGCTLDGEVSHPTLGTAVVQVKCTDWLIFKTDWKDGKVPPHIDVQVQTEMLVSEANKGYIACLVGGNDLHIIERDPDPELQDEIVARTNDFWASIDAGEEPDPLGTEAEIPEILKREFQPEREVNVSDSEEAYDALQGLKYYDPIRKEAKAGYEKAKRQIIALTMGEAGKVIGHGYGARIKRSSSPATVLDLPTDIKASLENLEERLDHPGDKEIVRAAIDWEHVTRRAGHRTSIDVWEVPTDDPPPWTTGFDFADDPALKA